jgi:hypothetical protein
MVNGGLAAAGGGRVAKSAAGLPAFAAQINKFSGLDD